jgi:hypothetical protein
MGTMKSRAVLSWSHAVEPVESLPVENATDVNVVTGLGVLLMLALLVWLPVYIACGVFWAVRSYCFAGELHPLLAPTLTGITATVLTILDLARGKPTGRHPACG